jgi:hypothetical protein
MGTAGDEPRDDDRPVVVIEWNLPHYGVVVVVVVMRYDGEEIVRKGPKHRAHLIAKAGQYHVRTIGLKVNVSHAAKDLRDFVYVVGVDLLDPIEEHSLVGCRRRHRRHHRSCFSYFFLMLRLTLRLRLP